MNVELCLSRVVSHPFKGMSMDDSVRVFIEINDVWRASLNSLLERMAKRSKINSKPNAMERAWLTKSCVPPLLHVTSPWKVSRSSSEDVGMGGVKKRGYISMGNEKSHTGSDHYMESSQVRLAHSIFHTLSTDLTDERIIEDEEIVAGRLRCRCKKLREHLGRSSDYERREIQTKEESAEHNFLTISWGRFRSGRRFLLFFKTISERG